MTMKHMRWMLTAALSILVLAGCGGRDRSSTARRSSGVDPTNGAPSPVTSRSRPKVA